MERPVQHGESGSILYGVSIAEERLTGQFYSEEFNERMVGPDGSAIWVSDNRGTVHISNDGGNAYVWVRILVVKRASLGQVVSIRRRGPNLYSVFR